MSCDDGHMHDSWKSVDLVAHGKLFSLVEHRNVGDYTFLRNKVKTLSVCEIKMGHLIHQLNTISSTYSHTLLE